MVEKKVFPNLVVVHLVLRGKSGMSVLFWLVPMNIHAIHAPFSSLETDFSLTFHFVKFS